MLDEGNTVPFIARYRKEATEGMDDEQLRLLAEKLSLYRNLEKTREDVARILTEAGVLTPELASAIAAAATATELEDIYRPYRPKKRTRAVIAREKGLEQLAEAVLKGLECPESEAKKYLNEEYGVLTEEDALAGARDIIAEMLADDMQPRREIRKLIFEHGLLTSSGGKEAKESSFETYYNFSEPLRKAQPHRILAMNRGEKEGFLTVKISFPDELAIDVLKKYYLKEDFVVGAQREIAGAIKDGWKRLLFPSLEREIRGEMTERAEVQALKIFKLNLRGLLLAAPVSGKRILGLDPGYRSGCKLACVDETGKLLETAVIYPTPPQSRL
ncbi:MAG: hypothetical protein M1552_06415 [Firmicutes bacterium]|nr:hypothetical protein [Bacillota bacterium]